MATIPGESSTLKVNGKKGKCTSCVHAPYVRPEESANPTDTELSHTNKCNAVQAVPDTVSLDALKRHTPHLALHDFFRRHFGRRGMLRQARTNFVESCAAYSVVCYLLQVRWITYVVLCCAVLYRALFPPAVVGFSSLLR